jgi:hypothetical protein
MSDEMPKPVGELSTRLQMELEESRTQATTLSDLWNAILAWTELLFLERSKRSWELLNIKAQPLYMDRPERYRFFAIGDQAAAEVVEVASFYRRAFDFHSSILALQNPDSAETIGQDKLNALGNTLLALASQYREFETEVLPE